MKNPPHYKTTEALTRRLYWGKTYFMGARTLRPVDDFYDYLLNNDMTVAGDNSDFKILTGHEYVDGEEHSAKDIGTGQLYGEWLLDPDNGKMEKLQ